MGLFAELGAGVCHHPALPPVMTQLGGSVPCPHAERGSVGGSQAAPMWVFLSQQGHGECVPGCVPGAALHSMLFQESRNLPKRFLTFSPFYNTK